MSNSRRDPRSRINIWWPVVAGIVVIAIESTLWFGADRTSGPLRWVWQFLFGPVSDASWKIIHPFLRKTGHFVGYGLLGLAWLRAWWFTLTSSRFLTDAALAMLGTALVASADEWHQTFIPNRTGTPKDVLLDCIGALTMQLIVYLFMRIARPKQLARAA